MNTEYNTYTVEFRVARGANIRINVCARNASEAARYASILLDVPSNTVASCVPSKTVKLDPPSVRGHIREVETL